MNSATVDSPLNEAEIAVLGGILFEGKQSLPNAALDVARRHLTSGEEFLNPRNRMIFAAMLRLADRAEPIDLTTLSSEIQKRGGDGRGELNYLAGIMERIPTAAMVEPHSRLVKDAAMKRHLENALTDARAALKDGTERGAVIADLLPRLQEMGEDAEQTAKKKRSLDKVILDYRQLLQAEIPERKMILTWLPEGSLAMVYAPRGLGKTFFGLSLAASIASGEPFMRWPVVEPCGVLYIDGEMALLELRKRITGFMSHPPAAPLLTFSHEIFYQEAERDLNITDEKIQKVILAYLDDNPLIRVLIVDNLSALTRIREDKGDDWRESFFPFIMQCRRRRVAVLLVHHAGKNGDQRGTGAREDALDITIKLSKADEDHRDGAYFRVDFTKARGVYGDTIKPFTAKLVKGADGFFTWTLKDVEEDNETRLVKLIEETGGISVTDAAEELGISKGTISKLKKRLADKGILKKTSPGTHALMELGTGGL